MGTVIVSVNIATGSIHANILFRGILKEGETRVPFTVRFQTTQGHETRSVEESVILDAPVAVSAKLIFTYFFIWLWETLSSKTSQSVTKWMKSATHMYIFDSVLYMRVDRFSIFVYNLYMQQCFATLSKTI